MTTFTFMSLLSFLHVSPYLYRSRERTPHDGEQQENCATLSRVWQPTEARIFTNAAKRILLEKTWNFNGSRLWRDEVLPPIEGRSQLLNFSINNTSSASTLSPPTWKLIITHLITSPSSEDEGLRIWKSNIHVYLFLLCPLTLKRKTTDRPILLWGIIFFFTTTEALHRHHPLVSRVDIIIRTFIS